MHNVNSQQQERLKIEIRPFVDGDEMAFRQLNERWITRFFKIEEEDLAILGDPQRYVLDRGGQILLAVADNIPIGCCALFPMEDGSTYEVVKMAVAEQFQGRNVGTMLLTSIIETARRLGAKRLYLETNEKLAPAIHLYKKLGFVRLQGGATPKSAYARAGVYMEKWL